MKLATLLLGLLAGSNAFTLAPVPGAIASVGATPVFVGVTERLVIDLDDLGERIADSGARVLMLSRSLTITSSTL